jgi:hypothetical protein
MTIHLCHPHYSMHRSCEPGRRAQEVSDPVICLVVQRPQSWPKHTSPLLVAPEAEKQIPEEEGQVQEHPLFRSIREVLDL